MDYDEIGNVTATPDESSENIAYEVIFTLCCVIGMCADAAIIYIIFHYKRMRTVPNMFLANWAIADLCSLIVTPSSYRIFSAIENVTLSKGFICFLYQTDLTFHCAAVLFMIVLTVDWCMAAYFPATCKKFRTYYKYVLASVWVFIVILLSISTRFCLKDLLLLVPHIIILFVYFALLLLVVAVQLSRVVQKCRKKKVNYPSLLLTLSTIYTACWFLGLSHHFFIEFPAKGFLFAIGIFVQCVIFFSSIIGFILLYRLNNDFHACVLQVLKRPDEKYESAVSEAESSAKSPNASGQELTLNA